MNESKTKKLLLIFGTRPEAIKMVPLIKELQKYPELFSTIICSTGQHREMLDQVLNLFNIKPNYDLNIMKPGQDLYDITSRTLLGLRPILDKVMPDIVLVHGDTTTSVTAGLASFYKQIPVGHIEAGLRSFNNRSPWPEEINRQITSRISSYHFVPTILGKQNLIKENISPNNIIITGNTVIDTLNLASELLEEKFRIQQIETQLRTFNIPQESINKWASGEKKMILITGHRRENFGEGIINISNAIKTLTTNYPNIDFVYPVHLNPNIQEPVFRILNDQKNVFLIKPLDYLPFIHLMKLSYLILTDSGGIQEEAPSLGKPVLVIRDTTERPEAVKAGTVMLVGSHSSNIEKSVSLLLENPPLYEKMKKSINPYGDGKASSRIVNFLKKKYFPNNAHDEQNTMANRQ